MATAKRSKRTRRTTSAEDGNDPTETKRQKFERLALTRMNRALNSIRLLGNLASYNYDWSEDDIGAMKAKIGEVADQTFARFSRHKRGEKPTFSFEREKESHH